MLFSLNLFSIESHSSSIELRMSWANISFVLLSSIQCCTQWRVVRTRERVKEPIIFGWFSYLSACLPLSLSSTHCHLPWALSTKKLCCQNKTATILIWFPFLLVIRWVICFFVLVHRWIECDPMYHVYDFHFQLVCIFWGYG